MNNYIDLIAGEPFYSPDKLIRFEFAKSDGFEADASGVSVVVDILLMNDDDAWQHCSRRRIRFTASDLINGLWAVTPETFMHVIQAADDDSLTIEFSEMAMLASDEFNHSALPWPRNELSQPKPRPTRTFGPRH